MAIIFLENEAKKKRLYISLFIILILGVIILLIFSRRGSVLPGIKPAGSTRLTLNLSVLDNPLLQKLKLPPTVPEFKQKIKRDNPFISHALSNVLPELPNSTSSAPAKSF